jgi:opacity protein-like surface antigen
MRRILIAGIVGVVSLVCCVPAEAQRPAARQRIGLFGFAEIGRQAFTSSETFDAILSDTWGTFPGGGGQVRWRQFVFEVSASRYERTGERAFVANGEVFRLGIPTTITLTPLEVTAAYRLRPVWRFVPYAGGGFVRQAYKETSQFAGTGEDVSDSHNGFNLTGGAEIRLWRWVSSAVELRYRSLPDAIGKGGVSSEFGEDDLGGTGVRVKILVGR